MRILIASAALAFTVDAFAQGVVSSHYPSLKGARDNKVFSRGLLPDVLPPSTHDIEVNYNMKSRVSSGAFRFKAAEYVYILGLVPACGTPPTPPDSLTGEISRLRRGGYTATTYKNEKAGWVFLCKEKPGVCEYRMWLNPG